MAQSSESLARYEEGPHGVTWDLMRFPVGSRGLSWHRYHPSVVLWDASLTTESSSALSTVSPTRSLGAWRQ